MIAVVPVAPIVVLKVLAFLIFNFVLRSLAELCLLLHAGTQYLRLDLNGFKVGAEPPIPQVCF